MLHEIKYFFVYVLQDFQRAKEIGFCAKKLEAPVSPKYESIYCYTYISLYIYFIFWYYLIFTLIVDVNTRKVRRAYESSWDQRCRLFFCCSLAHNRKIKVNNWAERSPALSVGLSEFICRDCPAPLRVLPRSGCCPVRCSSGTDPPETETAGSSPADRISGHQPTSSASILHLWPRAFSR